MARGMDTFSLLKYTTTYLRLCKRRECECCDLDEPKCGIDHYPCGYYPSPKAPDLGPDQRPPRSKLEYHCYCPHVLADGERLFIMVIAQHQGNFYYKLDNAAEILGRSHRQMTRLIKSLTRKQIVQQLTCKQAHCSDNHRSRHIKLSLHLPGMPAFDEMEQGYMNLARSKMEGR